MDSIEEGEGGSSHNGPLHSESLSKDGEKNKENNNNKGKVEEEEKDKAMATKMKANRPPPLELLDRVKMNTTLETPRSTIKGLLNFPKNSELQFNKENLNRIENQLKKAFVVFYHKLRLLKSYR